MLDCLEHGGTVVTGNARAARALAREYAEAQRAAGKTAWQTPQIHDWESWLSILWNQRLLNAEHSPLLLSPLQERAVWKRIILAEAPNDQAKAAESIAKLAAEAWKLLSAYAVHHERHLFWQTRATADAESFRNWALAFDRECHKQNWISRSHLAALLAESELLFPSEILLIGFDRITPAQQSLLDAARLRGASVSEWQSPSHTSTPQVVRAKDFREELATCANWIRRQLESNPDDHIAVPRLAVIVQDIDASRGEIDRAFRRILMPQSAGIDSRDPMPWEFSLGQPLAAVPVIKVALLLLRWLARPLAQAEISSLMLSGMFTTALAIDEMAALDAEMRKYGNLPPEAPLEALVSYGPRTTTAAARAFFATLRDLQHMSAAENLALRTASIPDWLEFADRIWKQARWPSARTLESFEFQALNRWDKLLSDLAALAFDGSRVTFAEFVTAIELYSEETIFAPESRNASIQIMGAFESAGQRFDAVWFLGADDQQWPPSGQAHPLLPQWLQRKAAMPHATFEIDWQLAHEITRRIAASAPRCVFSHAQRNDSGELRISALLRESFAKPISAEKFFGQLDFPLVPPYVPETVTCEDSTPIPWPIHIDAGGASILKDQAACPFKSFATRRLSARELESAERGLTPLDRGNVLHEVLESLWSAEPSHEKSLHNRADLLNAKANGSLSSLLDHHIERAFNERHPPSGQSEWMHQYLQVERQRLKKLLMRWLDYEAKRTDFTVAEREKDSQTEINGLKLNLRVDRIDSLSGGSLILDYKSGKVTPAMWDAPRPDDPQLPLYRIHRGFENIKGVLFAQIRVGDICFKGRLEKDTVIVTNKRGEEKKFTKSPLTDTTLGEWSDELSRLADEFLFGNAAVDPKSYEKTCKYCDLHSLCRVAETNAALQAALDGEDEAAEAESEEFSNE